MRGSNRGRPTSGERTPRIWVLLGHRTGDNNQVMALAEGLALPFEIRNMGYRRLFGYDLGRLRPGLLGKSLFALDRRARAAIRPPWPDLVIGIGRRSVPVARYIREQSGGRAKLVRIGNPRMRAGLFDLVITTRQYDVREGPQVLRLPVAMSRFTGPAPRTDADEGFLAKRKRPHFLFALGGDTKYVELPHEDIIAAAKKLAARASAAKGSLLIVPSRRTDPDLVAAIAKAVRKKDVVAPATAPRFAVLLEDADEIFVTADSASMVSEAVVTGKPVGMVPVRMTALGESIDDTHSSMRDLRLLWDYLVIEKLVGTIDHPIASVTVNPVETAVRAVRKLLGHVDEDAAAPMNIDQL